MLRILYDDFDQKVKNIHDEMDLHHSYKKKHVGLRLGISSLGFFYTRYKNGVTFWSKSSNYILNPFSVVLTSSADWVH